MWRCGFALACARARERERVKESEWEWRAHRGGFAVRPSMTSGPDTGVRYPCSRRGLWPVGHDVELPGRFRDATGD